MLAGTFSIRFHALRQTTSRDVHSDAALSIIRLWTPVQYLHDYYFRDASQLGSHSVKYFSNFTVTTEQGPVEPSSHCFGVLFGSLISAGYTVRDILNTPPGIPNPHTFPRSSPQPISLLASPPISPDGTRLLKLISLVLQPTF